MGSAGKTHNRKGHKMFLILQIIWFLRDMVAEDLADQTDYEHDSEIRGM